MKHLASRAAVTLLGRRLVARAARRLALDARYEGDANMRTNGELAALDAVFDRLRASEGHRVFIDCGANTGVYVAELLARARIIPMGSSVVHAFEPCAATFAALTATVSGAQGGNVAVVLNHLALSDVAGTQDLHVIHDGAGANSLFVNEVKPPERAEAVTVTTLDRYAEEQQIGQIDFIKIDAEGSDARIVAGAQRMLAAHAIQCLQFEYNHLWIYARSFLRDSLALLQRHGYSVGRVTPAGIEVYDRWHPELETFTQSAFLACVPEWTAAFRHVRWWNEPVRKGG